MKKILSIGLVTLSLIAYGNKKNLSSRDMVVVLKIAKAIHIVHPKLSEKKYMEYALGIYRASMKYEIEPMLLVSIAQQETTFREGLPEGAAGEHGICQIRKKWLSDSNFIKEFGTQTIADLENPSKNFLYAAWILRSIKTVAKKGALPYWAYYNSVKFHNRLKYYLGVSRYINQIKVAKVSLAPMEFPKRGIASGQKCLMAVGKKSKPVFPSVVVPRLNPTNLLIAKEQAMKTLYAFEPRLSNLP